MGGARVRRWVMVALVAATVAALPAPAMAQLVAPTGNPTTTSPSTTVPSPGRSNTGAANSANAPTTSTSSTVPVAPPPTLGATQPTTPPQPSANPNGVTTGLPVPLAQTAGPIASQFTPPPNGATSVPGDATAVGGPPSASAPLDPRLIASPTTSGLVQVLDDLAAQQRDLDSRVKNLEVAEGFLNPSALGASPDQDPRMSQLIAQERDLQAKLDGVRADLRQVDGVSVPALARGGSSAAPAGASALVLSSPGTLPRNPTAVGACAPSMLAPALCGPALIGGASPGASAVSVVGAAARPTSAAQQSSDLIRESAVRFLNEMVNRRAELTRQYKDIQADLEAAHLRLAATPPPTAASATGASASSVVRPLAAPSDALKSARASLADVTNRLNVVARAHALSADGRNVLPSRLAQSDIPPDYLALYQRAASTCAGLSWTVLAGIGSIETSHGRSTLPGVVTGANYAGAMGPMQFLAASWAAYGVDADGDGFANVYNPADSIYAAARYLCSNGAGDPSSLRSAIWAYNHADWYVNRVLDLAIRYGSSPLDTVAASATPASLIGNPNISMSPEAVADLLSGTIDPRVVAILGAAALEHRIVISVIKTGHDTYVKGTDRVSNHIVGRAVDISAVDSVDVSASNYAALDLALAILTSNPAIRPDEFGSPWLELANFPGAFSDADHSDHLHIGWDR